MRALMIITLLTFSVVANGADPDDTPETRLVAAEKCFATLDIAKLMDQVLAKDASCLAQAGIPVPNSHRVMPGRTKDGTVRDLAERALYIDEFAAFMPQRQGANKSATQEFLDQEKQDHDFLLSVAE
jgi:hypothetical protein